VINVGVSLYSQVSYVYKRSSKNESGGPALR
jgi:hypothetical protein